MNPLSQSRRVRIVCATDNTGVGGHLPLMQAEKMKAVLRHASGGQPETAIWEALTVLPKTLQFMVSRHIRSIFLTDARSLPPLVSGTVTVQAARQDLAKSFYRLAFLGVSYVFKGSLWRSLALSARLVESR